MKMNKQILEAINLTKYYFDKMTNISCESLDFDNSGNIQENIYTFVEEVFDKMEREDKEDRIGKEVDRMADDYTGIYSAFLMLSDSDDKYNFIEVLNTRVKHGVSIYTYNFMTNLIKKLSKNKDLTINYVHYPFPLTAELEEQRGQMNNNLVIFLHKYFFMCNNDYKLIV